MRSPEPHRPTPALVAGRAAAFSIEVTDFALVTHRVPADRIRRRLPSRYELQTFTDEGREWGLVTTTCFCNRDFRPTALQYPRHTFNETTYRTYVTHKRRAGVYFFGRYLGSRLAYTSQRALARDTYYGDFDVRVERTAAGFASYVCNVASPRGDTSFSIHATRLPPAIAPWPDGREHEQFLTFRPEGFFTSSAGLQAHAPVEHKRLQTWAGELNAGRFELWSELGIVPEREWESPYSVLVTPGARFILHAPRPLL